MQALSLSQKLRKKFPKQRGVVSLMAAGLIVVSLAGFDQMLEYGNAKILDRELDNYARTVAQVALRSELAITKAGIDAGTINANQTDLITNDLLAKVNMFMQDSDGQSSNLTKEITFGNFNEAGQFVKLSSDASNPRAAEDPIDFSAVAVQLYSKDSFLGVYTPQGRALYGLDASRVDEQGCYCKNRYTMCLDVDLPASELSPISAAIASEISVKGSQARKDYCRYGYTESSPNSTTATKYPWAKFDDGWIGRQPNTVNFFMFYQQGYDDASFSKVLEHKPLQINDGEDPLYQTGGIFNAMKNLMQNFMPWGGSDGKLAYNNDQSKFERRDITPSSNRDEYRCDKTGIFGFGGGVVNCDGANNSNDVVLNDSFYVGYEGTCTAGTSSKSSTQCLAYNDGGTERFESCLDIERRSSMEMNFFQRMAAFFFGPILDWERSYEGLDCEIKRMKYVGWMFWGGWKDV